MIALLHIGDVLAYFLDHASALMAQHAGAGDGIQPLDEMQITVADAGEDGADKNLAPGRFVDLDFLDGQGLVRRPHHRSFRFHCVLLPN